METLHFLNALCLKYQITDLKTPTTLNNAITDIQGNYYFIPGNIKESQNSFHAGDHDIISTSTFFIDVDLQSEANILFDGILKIDYTKEDHYEMASWIKEFCDQSEIFKNWRFIVFTGNGVHIHFTGDDVETENKIYQWKYGIKYFQKIWNQEADTFFGRGIYQADPACCNLSRLRRLPGTYNQKNGRKVEILYDKESKFDTSTILYNGEKEYIEVLKKEREIFEKERTMMRSEMRLDEQNIFETINTLPVEYFVPYVVPQAIIQKNGKNFKFEGQKNLCGFFKTIHNRIANGGSHHFLPFTRNGRELQSYSVFDIIHIGILKQTEFNKKTISETLLYFKENIYG